MRINKLISEQGICSRREADRLIEAGRVTINGQRAVLGSTVEPSDSVKVDGKLLRRSARDRRVYIAFNKPVGVVCTTDKKEPNNIIDYLDYPSRIFPIGRLDKDSEGLILLTNDGDIVNDILRSGNNHEKEYIVTVDHDLTQEFLSRMRNGVKILDRITKKCRVDKLGRNKFRIVLTEGMNRQIRRMCEAFDYEVTSLKRVRIMNIKLADLPTGYWRYLEPNEMEVLNGLIREKKQK